MTNIRKRRRDRAKNRIKKQMDRDRLSMQAIDASFMRSMMESDLT